MQPDRRTTRALAIIDFGNDDLRREVDRSVLCKRNMLVAAGHFSEADCFIGLQGSTRQI